MRSVILPFSFGLFLLGCSLEIPEPGKSGVSNQEIWKQAHLLAQELIIVDTHIDTPYRIDERSGEIDLSVRSEEGDFDFVRAQEGGLNAAFMSIYIPASFQGTGGAGVKADELIDLVESFPERWPRLCAIARSPSEVRRQKAQGLISLPMGMENGAALGDNLSSLKYFYDRGIRYITLTHSRTNQICDSSYDRQIKWNGLSPFGRKVVAEMNRLGIMIDVSHVTDDAFFQVLRTTQTPIIASHSSCRYFTPEWERNMSDEMIRALSENGGVIQINFGSMFLDDQYLKTQSKIFEGLEKFRSKHRLSPQDSKARAYFEELRKQHPLPRVDVWNVVDHINHVVELVGIDHVGLGSDFDGVGDSIPADLKDVSMYPNLIYALLSEGYSAEEIKQICGENLLRVWEHVEAFAESNKRLER